MKLRLIAFLVAIASVASANLQTGSCTVILSDGTTLTGEIRSVSGNTMVVSVVNAPVAAVRQAAPAVRIIPSQPVRPVVYNYVQSDYGRRDNRPVNHVSAPQMPPCSYPLDYTPPPAPSRATQTINQHRTAITGATLGALAGGVIGNNSGDRDGTRGAVIGGVAGLLLGVVSDAHRNTGR